MYDNSLNFNIKGIMSTCTRGETGGGCAKFIPEIREMVVNVKVLALIF